MNTSHAFCADGRSSLLRLTRSCAALARSRFRLVPVAAVCTALCSPSAQAQVQLPALLEGGQRIGVNAPSVSGATMTIIQTQARGVIEWSNFSIGAGGTVNISQPGGDSVLLNRVLSNGNGSQINGGLFSNGRVFILDPSGISFGAGSRINVGSLVAAAMDLRGGSEGYSAFVNQGTLALESPNPFGRVFVDARADLRTTALDGEAGLLAPGSVEVLGTITTPSGRTWLAGAGGADIAIGSSGFVTFKLIQARPQVEQGYTPPLVSVNGIITAPDGEIQLAVSGVEVDSEGIVRPRINIGGLAAVDASATRAENAGGRVLIDGEATGDVEIFGQVSAIGQTTGGTIAAAGRSVSVFGTLTGEGEGRTTLTAEGFSGGGTIRLGDANTRALRVDGSASLLANGLVQGAGGTIDLTANYLENPPQRPPEARETFGVADLFGSFSARGGTQGGGGGGTIRITAQALNTVDRSEGGSVAVFASGPSIPSGAPGRFEVVGPGITVVPGIAVASSLRGVRIEADRINEVLDQGSDVTLTAGDPLGALNQTRLDSSAQIRRSVGTATLSLTLQADADVVLAGGAGIVSSAGPLDVQLLSNRRGQGGSVSVQGNLETSNQIATAGGNLFIGGGFDPATDFSLGLGGNSGVSLRVTDIDTRGSDVGGSITIRGAGRDGDVPGDGLFIEGGSINAGPGSISMTGRAETGSGIRITSLGNPDQPALLQASGGIALRGLAQAPVEGSGSGTPTGVTLNQTTIQVGAGGLTIAGRGAADPQAPGLQAIGIAASDFTMVANENSTATLTLVGQSVGAGGYGVGGAVGTTFSYRVVGTDGVTGRTGANVVVGASASRPADAIDTDGLPPEIATLGNLSVRPAGVDAEGNIVNLDSTPIQVALAGDCIAGNFCLPISWLREVTNSAQGPAHIQAGHVVIGSQSHAGTILLDGSGAASNLLRNITIQNEGSGSGGVVLQDVQHLNDGSGLSQLSVLSSGPVTQAGSLLIDRLLLRAPEVNLRLTGENANRFGTLAFDVSGTILTQSFFDTSIGTGAATGFDPAADGGQGRFIPVSVTTNRVGSQGDIQTFNGQPSGATFTLNAPIELGPSGFNLTLSTDGLFQNPSNSPITSLGEGTWNVFSRTWEGANRGGLVGSGPVPNAYGCSTIGCPNTINLVGSSGFRYIDRPALTITPKAVQFNQGQPVPTIDFTVAGFVNGDTPQSALSGAIGTTATSQSEPGVYPATEGNLISPLGYALSVAGGSENTVVTVLPASVVIPPVLPPAEAPFTPGNGLGRAYGFALLSAEASSEVNGRNLSRAQMCVAPGALRREREAGEGTDNLGIEWSRVRSQPHLSNCLEIGDDNECAAF